VAIATNTEKQNLATQYGNNAAYASLHTADPGTTGTAEVSGGAPAYARKALTWTPGTTGTNTATATFDVPTSTTITYCGLWTAVTGGTFLDKAVLGASQTFASQGTYQLSLTFTQS
jgi:hypothetical protein